VAGVQFPPVALFLLRVKKKCVFLPIMVDISVIIPAVGERDGILGTLDSILAQEGSFEVLVCTKEGDPTKDVVKNYALLHPDLDIYVVETNGPTYRSSLMNLGGAVAQGDVYLFLHADTSLPKDAFGSIQENLRDDHIVGGAFHLRFDYSHWFMHLVAGMSNVRLHTKNIMYGDQGIYVRSGDFCEMDGFNQCLTLFEDVDFSRRLRERGNLAFIKTPVTTSGQRFAKNGPVRQFLLNCYVKALYVLKVDTQTIRNKYEHGFHTFR
jgi:glycosyltransferase involved in cell wall biosynthesis